MIKNGISIIKENAVTTLATTAERNEAEFAPYFAETLQFLIGFLNEFSSSAYKQFRGQTIEGITLICAAVGEETFKPLADDVIKVLLHVQNNQLDTQDCQRIYLLSSWQRICLLMKEDFAPYLKDVIPPILKMASLQPSMGVSGGDHLAKLVDVLSEVIPNKEGEAEDGEKKVNVHTDEIDEKDTALQMLAVIIEECGAGFAPYIEEASTIITAMLDFGNNDNIRSSAADTLPYMVKSAKAANIDQTSLFNMCKKYVTDVSKAIAVEWETEVKISQINALKDILDEAGPGFYGQEEVDGLSTSVIGLVDKSLERIE
jgi:hypothetical protein